MNDGERTSAPLAAVEGQIDSLALHIRRELEALTRTIGDARAEIAALEPQRLSRIALPAAADRLGAIVRSTEDAAGRIMDGAEELIALATEVDGPASERLNEIATTIFESAEFQDITGQHVSRVLSVLRTVETRLADLAVAVGDIAPLPAEECDGAICRGPDCSSEANDQEAIDRLMGNAA